MGVPHSVGRSKVSMMSLTPNGTPASGPRLLLLSKARAPASAASGSRCAQAWTPGSRAAMRSRQARTTASQVVCPWPIAAMISVAVSSLSGLMELTLAANGAIEPHSRQAAHQRGTMPKKQVSSEKISKPNGHFSQATVTEARGRIVFISGMTSRRPDGAIAGIGHIEAQTHEVCQNVKAAVGAGGSTMDDICRIDAYVSNMEHFENIPKLRQEYFKTPPPASTMVKIVKMASPEYLI